MEQMRFGLQGKRALVTGGSRGIGLELARALVAEGARVMICSRKKENLEAAAAQLDGGRDLVTAAAHIGRDDQVEAMFQQVESLWGGLDILVNNVGMNLMTSTMADTDPALWRKIIDTNLTGTFLCSRAAARIMRSQEAGGKIVSVSSVAARKASPAMGVYGVAKAGVEMLTRVLAAELAPKVQVNAVAPGMVKTGFSRPFWSNPELHDQIVSRIPLGRLAETTDVVGPILFLLSRAADYLTGQTLVLDGGAQVV